MQAPMLWALHEGARAQSVYSVLLARWGERSIEGKACMTEAMSRAAAAAARGICGSVQT